MKVGNAIGMWLCGLGLAIVEYILCKLNALQG